MKIWFVINNKEKNLKERIFFFNLDLKILNF